MWEKNFHQKLCILDYKNVKRVKLCMKRLYSYGNFMLAHTGRDWTGLISNVHGNAYS